MSTHSDYNFEVPSPERDLHTSRLLSTPRGLVFQAFSDPTHLAAWWGPDGFTNTFHTFEFREGGAWIFTMHGPNGQDYANENAFTEIVEPERIVIDHRCAPRFRIRLTFAEEGEGTRLDWRMRFETAALCEALKDICIPANEQNLDRLEAELARMRQADSMNVSRTNA